MEWKEGKKRVCGDEHPSSEPPLLHGAPTPTCVCIYTVRYRRDENLEGSQEGEGKGKDKERKGKDRNPHWGLWLASPGSPWVGQLSLAAMKEP